eukprot:821145_1
MTLRFSNLTKFGVWVFALAAVVHALNDILTDSESDSDELLYSIIEDSYYTWRNSQDVLNAKKGAGSSCISIAVFIVVLLVALLIGSGSALGVGYFFFYKKKMTAKEEEIEKLTKQIGVKAENIKTLETQIATLKASPSNAAGSSISGDAPDPTEIARLKGEVQTLEEKLGEMTGELEGLREELEQAKNAAAAAVRPQHTPPPAGPSNQDLENEYGLLRAQNDELQEQLLNLANNNDSANQFQQPPIPPLRTSSDIQSQQSHAREVENVPPTTNDLNDLDQFGPENEGRIHNTGQYGYQSMHVGQGGELHTGDLDTTNRNFQAHVEQSDRNVHSDIDEDSDDSDDDDAEDSSEDSDD